MRSFNVRMTDEKHERLKVAAMRQRISMNIAVNMAVDLLLDLLEDAPGSVEDVHLPA